MSIKYNGDVYGSANNCGCHERYAQACGENEHLAVASVPMQIWRLIYSCDEALLRGTLFEELDFPFEGGKC